MTSYNVCYLKSPSQFFFRGSREGHVRGHHELLEVDAAVAVAIEDPEDLKYNQEIFINIILKLINFEIYE